MNHYQAKLVLLLSSEMVLAFCNCHITVHREAPTIIGALWGVAMASVPKDLFTGIIDLSHHQSQHMDFAAYAAAGGAAVIHKATEALTFRDDRYASRRAAARQAGLLWGSYHFAGDVNEDGIKQADHYLDTTQPTADELVCFDCEKHGTLENMESFVKRIYERLGRLPVIYGRNLLRELLKHTNSPTVTQCALWYDEYPPDPLQMPRQDLPRGWEHWTLWQYTNGRDGPGPHHSEGIGDTDRNAFRGTADDLRKAWPLSLPPKQPMTPALVANR